MARCEGTTKAGVRCRRQAGADASFCVSHGAMRTEEAEPAVATEKPTAGGAEKPASGASEEPSARATEKHPLASAAVVGLVALGLLALRRLIRLF